MANISAKRYVCPVCGAEYIVTRPGEGELSCCGGPMEPKPAETAAATSAAPPAAGGSVRGARYDCAECGTQILCIAQGAAPPACCGALLSRKTVAMNAVSE